MNAKEVKHIERETDEEGQRKRGSLRLNRFNRHAGDSLSMFFFLFLFFFTFLSFLVFATQRKQVATQRDISADVDSFQNVLLLII